MPIWFCLPLTVHRWSFGLKPFTKVLEDFRLPPWPYLSRSQNLDALYVCMCSLRGRTSESCLVEPESDVHGLTSSLLPTRADKLRQHNLAALSFSDGEEAT